MNLNDEIKIELNKLPVPPKIIDEWEEIADSLSDSFDWLGSKIDWSRTYFHKTICYKKNENIHSVVNRFFNENCLNEFISNSDSIYYICDSSLDFALQIEPSQFFKNLFFIIDNVPQHHYFFDDDTKWCLAITMEGFIDFGCSIKV